MSMRYFISMSIFLGLFVFGSLDCQQQIEKADTPKRKKILKSPQTKVARAPGKKATTKTPSKGARARPPKVAKPPLRKGSLEKKKDQLEAMKAPAPAPGAGARPRGQEGAVSGYIYDPTGKPDPFQPLVIAVARGKPRVVKRRKCPPGPLAQSEVQQFKVVGILRGAGMEKVLIEDPTGKGYLIRLGVCIGKNGGKVFKITKDGILIEEFYVDLLGEEKRRIVSLKLKP